MGCVGTPPEAYQCRSEISLLIASETFTQRRRWRIGAGSLNSNGSVNGASVDGLMFTIVYVWLLYRHLVVDVFALACKIVVCSCRNWGSFSFLCKADYSTLYSPEANIMRPRNIINFKKRQHNTVKMQFFCPFKRISSSSTFKEKKKRKRNISNSLFLCPIYRKGILHLHNCIITGILAWTKSFLCWDQCVNS